MSQICPLIGEKWPTPEMHLPDDDELLALVRQRPLISLREICGSIWPGLPWRPASAGGASATSPAPALRGHSCADSPTLAAWLRRRLLGLIAGGVLRLGPFRRGEPQEAGLTYYAHGIPDAAVAPASRPGVVPIGPVVIDA